MKRLKIKKDLETEDLYLDLQDFSDIVDINKVDNYTLESVDDDGNIALILKFYDKDNNIIEVKD